MQWSPQQLEAFLAVSGEATMAEAADRLGLSLAAVSQRIAALQAGLPEPLLVRDGRRLVTTDAGRTFARYAERILATAREAEQALAADATRRATVTLGVFGSAAATIVPAAMHELAGHAAIAVETREIGVDELGAAVAAGRVDLGLGVGYADAPEPPLRGVDTEVLQTEELLLALPPGSDPDPAGRAALADRLDWILGPASSYFGRAVRVACGRAGITPRVRHEVTDTAVAIALAEAGAGITPVTARMVRLRSTSSPLVPLPVPAYRQVVIRARRAQLSRPSVRAVADALTRATIATAGGAAGVP